MKIANIHIISGDTYRPVILYFINIEDKSTWDYHRTSISFVNMYDAILYCDFNNFKIVDSVTWQVSLGMKYFPDLLYNVLKERFYYIDREIKHLMRYFNYVK